MNEVCETIMVMADNDMGCMVINKSDFDPAVHLLMDAEPEATAMTKAELIEALDAKGIEHKSSMTKAELQALLEGV